MLLIPKGLQKPAPAIILAHGHSGSKENLCINEKNAQCAGPTLARHGYVVAAISHPYDAIVTVFPDGSRIVYDQNRWPKPPSL